MLFLLKRTWQGGLVGLLILVPTGLGIRHYLGDVPPVGASWQALGLGVAVFVLVLASDILLHGLCTRTFGEAYRRRYRELAGLYREQAPAAILTGAVLAGLGEELALRGFSDQLPPLFVAAGLFGLLHHFTLSLWPFTVWAAFQGLLFALALHFTGALFVTMTAHFLHDLSGFLVFRGVNRSGNEVVRRVG